MKIGGTFALLSVVFTLTAFAQVDAAPFKTETRSTFIWGEDALGGAISWTVRDPLTGAGIFKLRYAGIEVSSRMGFEKIRTDETQELIAYTTTVVNNTEAVVSVGYGGITIDGHIVSPLSLVPSRRTLGKKLKRNDVNVVEVAGLYCFKSGFLSDEYFLPTNQPSFGLDVEPQHSLTVSSVVRDPRHYPILCSAEGCLPKGTIRYAIRVGSHDYVFVWPGQSIVNCGR
jgi:hypothetical protein